MAAVRVSIIAWVDDHQPGFVRCELQDAWDRVWSFVEKAPVLSAAELWNDSSYPQPGVIACEIVRRWVDDRGRHIMTIDTSRPWGVETEAGETTFDVLPTQMESEASV